MSGTEKIAECRMRAAAAREIARGIFDPNERRLILQLIDDFEKLSAERPARKTNRKKT
jgi:hypothetical protein